MKKFVSLIIAVASLAIPAVAEMKQETASGTAVTTNQVTDTLRIRGELKNLYFNIPTGKTGTMNIVSSEGFVVLGVTNVALDTLYVPRIPISTIAGVAITEAGGGATNDTLNVIYDTLAVVGDCTVTWIPHANVTGTNTWTVTANFVQ